MLDVNDYQNFVNGLLSPATRDATAFQERVKELTDSGVSVQMLLTAAVGLPGEAGEVSDLIKKVVFQGKPYTDDIRNKLIDEMGDVAWYLALACSSVGVTMEDILERNVEKLQSRYPGGFSINRSENR